MHQHDPQHTGRSQLNGPQGPNPSVLWAVRHHGQRRSAPSVGVDGTIYLGASRTPVTAIDPANGTEIWEANQKGGQTDRSQPAVDVNGNVYLGARDNDLWSVDPTGDVNWRYSVTTDGDVTTPPTIAADGTIFMASDSLGAGRLYALNPDGSVKWLTVLGKGVKNVSPALSLDQTELYVTAAGHQAIALDAQTGAELWRLTLQVGTAGSRHNNYTPVVGADGTLYFGLRSGLYAVDPSGPSVLWEFSAPKELIMSPPALAADGTIYLVSSGRPSAVVRAINPDGTVKWEETILGRGRARNTPPVVGADGKVYVGAGNFLTCFTPEGNGLGDAEIVWQMLFPKQFQASPVIGGAGVLYFGLSDHRLYAVTD
jgi:outer membrane protein assembly factor BamB